MLYGAFGLFLGWSPAHNVARSISSILCPQIDYDCGSKSFLCDCFYYFQLKLIWNRLDDRALPFMSHTKPLAYGFSGHQRKTTTKRWHTAKTRDMH